MHVFGSIALLLAAAAPAAGASSPSPAVELASASCSGLDLPAGAQCGSLSVPENWARPDGRQIALWTVRVPASSVPAKGALFVFQGGPGQAATKLADFYARVYGPARTSHDIILIDQRGTGRSNGLNCDFGGSPATPQRYLADLFDPAVVRSCAATLSERAELSQYTTSAAVRDAEAVRRALHYDRIDLYGTSYGTRVAMEDARRYPARVRTITLKGVVAPDVTAPAEFASDVERSVGLMLRDCAAEPACASAFPELRADLQRAISQVAPAPVRATLPDGQVVTLSRGMFGATVRTMLQATSLRAELPMLINSAAQGNWQPYVARVLELRKAAQSEIATGLMLSVLCTEDVPYLNASKARKAAGGTLLGSYWLDQVSAACRLWPRGKVPSDWRRPYKLSAPTLLISGELDPATPPGAAERTRSYLRQSLHLVAPGGSHSFSGMTGCIDVAMSTFLGAGRLDAVDPSCASKISAPPFKSK
jgi:pimeloyl-ACP methyl ester carboxylesterase